jgi:hypothetical protein
MFRQRIKRIESFLNRRAMAGSSRDGPTVWTAALAVKTLRALLSQVPAASEEPLADPFPELQGADYLAAFCPWLLANDDPWPVWAQEYALRVCGLSARDASRFARRGSKKSPERRVQTAQDILDLLQEQVTAVRSDEATGALEKARAIATLAGIARRTIETGQVAARVEMLEAVLKNRTGTTK